MIDKKVPPSQDHPRGKRVKFEELLTDLSVRFVNVPTDRVDQEIEDALKQVLKFFEADRCGLLEVSDDRRVVRLSHAAFAEGVEHVSKDIDLAGLFPWHYGKLVVEQRHVAISTLEDLPEEAQQDKQSFAAFGISAALHIPLFFGGQVVSIFALNVMREHRLWPEEHVARLHLLGEIFVNALEHKLSRQKLEDRLEFERLLSELSARFVNVSAGKVDGEIESAQRRLCECLGFDRSSVWQRSPDDPGLFVLTHLHQPPDAPSAPEPSDARLLFPWALKKILNGDMVAFSRLGELPHDAARDREVWRYYGTKSVLVFPLSAGGGPVFGGVAFDAIAEERDWPEQLVKSLALVAQIFANALARKHADRALRESEERLNLAAASARAGLWSLDPVSGHVWATEKGKELIGFGPEQELDFESFLEMVHPEDRDRVRRTVQHAVASSKDAAAEYRVSLPDGSIRWFLSRGHPYSASPGEPARLMGVTIDITDRKESEDALKISEAKYRQLHESMMDAFVSVDMDGRLLEFNEVYRKMLGYTREELLPLTYRDLTPEKWHASENDIIENQVLLRGYSDIYEKEYRRKEGEIFPVELRTILLRDNDGRPRAMWAVVRDISERKQMEQQLRDRLREIEELRQQVERENIYLRQSAKLLFDHDRIVGESESLKRVLAQAEQVAATDSTVLLLGETGTGKELVAQTIHDLSGRKDRVMVTVNCASLPAALIESELFGREKGAYTGALTRQIGRFELADGSTIFLDEIAELPLELQAKLLRVLQEGTFERLGSPKTIKVDVRVIAASNHDLLAAMRAGTFREDLYYRLNVFPIEVPPLRERTDDIPLLVEAFVGELSRKLGKKITLVPRRAVEALQRYRWPGNVREIRNVIEQAIILSDDGVLNVKIPQSADTGTPEGVSLEEAEYMHITGVLQKTGWRIKGRDGAAELLGLKPSTLYTKMEKLGIPKRRDRKAS